MLINKCDAAGSDEEWRTWLAAHDFGQLVANGPKAFPIIVPTPFLFVASESEVLIHLARTNPIWEALEANPHAVLSVVDDYAFVPAPWRATPPSPPEHGIPTMYYAAVQLHGKVSIIDEPEAKAALVRKQLSHFQPQGDYAPMEVEGSPYSRLLPAIRGLRLEVTDVRAKFKYDDHKPPDFREAVSARLEQRNRPTDAGARIQQLRRLGSES
jgi:transcriptional regulator